MRSAFLVFFFCIEMIRYTSETASRFCIITAIITSLSKGTCYMSRIRDRKNNVSCRYSREAIFAYLVCSTGLLYSECPTIRNDALESSRTRRLGLHLSVLSLYVRTSSPNSSNLSSYVTELVFPLITLANTINITNNGDTTEAFCRLESVVFSSK